MPQLPKNKSSPKSVRPGNIAILEFNLNEADIISERTLGSEFGTIFSFYLPSIG
jgi:hypothetical protein